MINLTVLVHSSSPHERNCKELYDLKVFSYAWRENALFT